MRLTAASEALNHQDIRAFTVTPDGTNVVAGRDTIAFSRDEGESWRHATVTRTDEVSGDEVGSVRKYRGIAVSKIGIIVVAGGGFVARSEDGGLTWRESYEVKRFAHLAYASRSGALFLVGEEVWRSLDNGVTWEETTLSSSIYALAETPSGLLVAVGDDTIIYRSTDDGAQWTQVGKSTHGSLRFVRATGLGSILAGGKSGKIMRSDDDGMTWS